MSRWQWLMRRLTRRLWVRATLIGAMGILAAVMAAVVDRYIPWKLPGSISADAVESILTIIASSMLAVTTFSLSTMVSAYGSATSNVTPRATRLVIEDRLTQTVLSNFIGAFLFGIVGMVVLKTGVYGERGRVVLFVITIGVIAMVVVSLLSWVDHLTRLGRVDDSTERVEDATRRAILAALATPCLGGTRLPDVGAPRLATAVAVSADTIGYVQNVDMPALSRACESWDTTIAIGAIPGTFVYADTTLAWIERIAGDADAERAIETVRAAFVIGNVRSFDQDPRFGLAVMSEIASRALSPALNDAGTAIDVIGRLTRLLSDWASGGDGGESSLPEHPRVQVPPLRTDDLFDDAFTPIGRDGAAMIEVQVRLQKALLALSRIGHPAARAAALRHSRMALARAQAALSLEDDRIRLRTLVDEDAGGHGWPRTEPGRS